MTSVPGRAHCGQWGLALWPAECSKKEKLTQILLVKYYQHDISALNDIRYSGGGKLWGRNEFKKFIYTIVFHMTLYTGGSQSFWLETP